MHENYGKLEKYSGCMTAGGYKESYCEAYVDQQSGNSSIIGAGINLTINVSGPVVNSAQTLNAYWHSHRVQERTFSDPLGTVRGWANQIIGSMQRDYGGQTPPSDPNQLAQGDNQNPPTAGGSVVAPPLTVCVLAPGGGACVATPPVVAGGTSGAPSNWTLSSSGEGYPKADDAGVQWVSVNEAMSPRARNYQEQITRSSGKAYVVEGAKFDGVGKDGALLDAKGPGYEQFVAKNGQFQPWFESLIDQAERQVVAANGRSIQWSVAEPAAARAIQTLLSEQGIKGISIIYVAPK